MIRLIVSIIVLCITTSAFAQRTRLVFSHGSDEASLQYRLNISSGDSSFCYLFPYNNGSVDVDAQAMFFAPDVPVDTVGFHIRLTDSAIVYMVASNTTELGQYRILNELHGPLSYGFYLTYCSEQFRFYGLVEPMQNQIVNVGRCYIGGAFYTPAPQNSVQTLNAFDIPEASEEYYDVLGRKVFVGTSTKACQMLDKTQCYFTRHGKFVF